MTKRVEKKSLSAFGQGIALGFAAPLMYFGPLPPYQLPQRDNVGRSWANVSDALFKAVTHEASRVRNGG